MHAMVLHGALALLVAGATVAACREAPPELPAGALRIHTSEGPATLHAEIADTDDARRMGLMGRSRLAPDAGMVFLFQEPTNGSFWMKDTLIPLSIAFWDARDRIVAILEMTPCLDDPCPTYSPNATYVGAVEANRGWFADHGVRLGDRVELLR